MRIIKITANIIAILLMLFVLLCVASSSLVMQAINREGYFKN